MTLREAASRTARVGPLAAAAVLAALAASHALEIRAEQERSDAIADEIASLATELQSVEDRRVPTAEDDAAKRALRAVEARIPETASPEELLEALGRLAEERGFGPIEFDVGTPRPWIEDAPPFPAWQSGSGLGKSRRVRLNFEATLLDIFFIGRFLAAPGPLRPVRSLRIERGEDGRHRVAIDLELLSRS